MIRLYVAAALLVLLLGSLVGTKLYIDHLQHQVTEQKDRADAAEQAWKVEHDARYEERANAERLEGQLNAAHIKTDQLTTATRAADRSAVSLQQYASRLAEQCGAGQGAASAASGVATTPAGNLLADMHRRTDEAAGEFALYADKLRIASEACVGLYPVKP